MLTDTPGVRRGTAGFALGFLLVSGAAARGGEDPAIALERAIATAESSLQKGEFPAAETHYREALFEGWLLMGTLERLDDRLPEARDSYREALVFAAGSRERARSLAGGFLQAGEAAAAVEILTPLAAEDPHDVETRRLLARAHSAAGQPDQAARRLDEAAATAPDDPEVAFLLATEYLWLKRVDAADRLFAQVVKERPIPQTHVLIGRAYRDAGEYERARAELQQALAQDPGVRRAHYYLGMVALADAKGTESHLAQAEAEFRAELKLAPEDPLANDQLGLALLDAVRPAEALPLLETAVRVEARSLFVYHLGRCQLALQQAAEAVGSLRRALELAGQEEAADAELEPIHYQLGQALRRLGQAEEAAVQLTEASRLAARRRTSPGAPRGDGAEPRPAADAARAPRIGSQGRRELKGRVTADLARAYFNLAVLQVQSAGPEPAERYARAAALFEKVAGLDSAFPQVQSSLGVAYFNARQFAKSEGPLTRALAEQPANAGLKRMLAIASVNTESWAKAAALLQDDPGRESDPALEFAYGLSLLRLGRPAEAEKVLTRLAARGGDSPELRLLLGQAQLAQQRYDEAVVSLRRAVEENPAAEEAHASLGVALMGLGRPAEGLEELEAAVRLAPESPHLHEQLGQAYQKLGRTKEAEEQLATSRRLQTKGQGPKP
jgi:tetratricopeptide (TPR) repeat protein